MTKHSMYYHDAPGKNPGFCRCDCTACSINATEQAPRFRQEFQEDGQELKCGDKDASHILFLMRGGLLLQKQEGESVMLNTGQCYFYTRDEIVRITARSSVYVIRVDFVRRLGICDKDCLGELGWHKCSPHLSLTPPLLTINPMIMETLMNLFKITGLESKTCYHRLKLAEIFMMMTQLYNVGELVCFFRSIIRPTDDFRAFVLTHYSRVTSIAEFARIAGMSKSVFQTRFTETFGETVSRWLAKQKAEGVRAAIREGITSAKDLMLHFGFSNDDVFGRFCKRYMGGTPTQVIAKETELKKKWSEKTNQ